VSRRYTVKELFVTLQGEGANTGRTAVFCRFTGCNLWSGHERHRASAVCQFCDTDFVGTDGPGGGRYAARELAAAATARWRDVAGAAELAEANREPFVVCTGGEPLLQLDTELIDAFHEHGFEIAIETNGTLAVPAGIEWVCVSPKADAPLVVDIGDELKLVYPQPGTEPERYAHLAFDHFFLQPMDGPDREANTAAAVAYCLAHPRWRLSLQTHKYLGIP
jgi:7-carboxy-7-deazaguanine synthase (Cx14CxxC type)